MLGPRTSTLKLFTLTTCLFVGFTFNPGVTYGQAGLRRSLEMLDRNENGYIDPDEITPLSRPYLERITRERRLRLDRPIEISELQKTARIYYAKRNGTDDDRVRPEAQGTVKSFGPQEDEPLIPGFGLAKIKYPYTQDDLDEADQTLRRSDRDRDGYLDRREIARAKWSRRDPYDDDLNKDDKLSRMELAQRYARRRLLEQDVGELIRRAVRTGGEIEPSDKNNSRRSRNRYSSTQYLLTSGLLDRFDADRSGQLEARETLEMNLPIGQIDLDNNDIITRDELFSYVQALQESVGDSREGLPGWFYELDTDQDQQITMQEFLAHEEHSSPAAFTQFDVNQDGFLTANEVLDSKVAVGGEYRNDEAMVLPPRRTIISEIEIEDDMIISDVNVQLSITHNFVSFLDAYVTGPDGQRVELFTEIGGSGDHFNNTIFDDQARYPISRGRYPYKGSYLPEALERKQPGLSQFNGTSAKGVWQLIIRGTRNERFGMLHGWGLIIRPEEKLRAPMAEDEDSEDDDLNSENPISEDR